MQLFIFIVGLFVSILVIYGIFSQVPAAIRPTEEEYYKNPKIKQRDNTIS